MAINPTFAWSLAWRVHALLCIWQNSSSSPTKLASSETPNWRQNACAGCSRWVALSQPATRFLSGGHNRLLLSGRLGGRRLAPGRYRLVVTPTDRAQNLGAPAYVSFRIVRA